MLAQLFIVLIKMSKWFKKEEISILNTKSKKVLGNFIFQKKSRRDDNMVEEVNLVIRLSLVEAIL